MNDAIVALAAIVIPTTDSPGAAEACVNHAIDIRLARSSAVERKSFLESLRWLEHDCRRRYGRRFYQLPLQKQTEFIKSAGGSARGRDRSSKSVYHFNRVKAWIVQAYYESEIGMRELGWSGVARHVSCEGCLHPGKDHGFEK
jgi:hypothetical protein